MQVFMNLFQLVLNPRVIIALLKTAVSRCILFNRSSQRKPYHNTMSITKWHELSSQEIFIAVLEWKIIVIFFIINYDKGRTTSATWGTFYKTGVVDYFELVRKANFRLISILHCLHVFNGCSSFEHINYLYQ